MNVGREVRVKEKMYQNSHLNKGKGRITSQTQISVNITRTKCKLREIYNDKATLKLHTRLFKTFLRPDLADKTTQWKRE